MMRFRNVYEVTKRFLLAPLVVLVICLSVSNYSSGSTKQKQSFQVLTPDLSRLRNSTANSTDVPPCAAEATVLAAALEALDAARIAADEAYDAWVACMSENNPDPNPDPNLPGKTTFSILEKSN